MKLFGSRDALQQVLQDMKNADPEVRMQAAGKLADLGKVEAVPALIRALSDSDRRVRWSAAYALSDFGEQGHDASYEALVLHLKSEPDWNVRRIIVMSLRHWDERALPVLIRALEDSSAYVRRYAAMTLGFKRAAAALPELKRLTAGDESKEVRDYAAWAVEKIGGTR